MAALTPGLGRLAGASVLVAAACLVPPPAGGPAPVTAGPRCLARRAWPPSPRPRPPRRRATRRTIRRTGSRSRRAGSRARRARWICRGSTTRRPGRAGTSAPRAGTSSTAPDIACASSASIARRRPASPLRRWRRARRSTCAGSASTWCAFISWTRDRRRSGFGPPIEVERSTPRSSSGSTSSSPNWRRTASTPTSTSTSRGAIRGSTGPRRSASTSGRCWTASTRRFSSRRRSTRGRCSRTSTRTPATPTPPSRPCCAWR